MAKNISGDTWHALLPDLHRVMRDPFPGAMKKLRPKPEEDNHSSWFAALYLARIILGWSDVGRGLRALVTKGITAPPGSHAELLTKIWGDGLYGFLGWAWENGPPYAFGNDKPRSLAQLFQGEQLKLLLKAMKDSGFIGGDPKHLYGHLDFESILYAHKAVAAPASASVVRDDAGKKLAIVADSMLDAYQALAVAAPIAQGEGRWTADLTSRADGWLGQWRLCKSCQRWFQGESNLHNAGHSDAATPPTS